MMQHDHIQKKGPKVGYGVIGIIKCTLKTGFKHNKLHQNWSSSGKVITE